MKIIDTEISDIKIIEPRVFSDSRGYFMESWNYNKFKENGINCQFIQDNESFSTFGVLRGLHYQLPPYSQAKLVRVISGEVLDIAVDIRKDSPTFGKHVAVRLSSENKRQLFIGKGMAHGFVVLSKEVTFAYKCDNLYQPTHERTIAFDDKELNIDWIISPNEMIISDKDKLGKTFAEAEKL